MSAIFWIIVCSPLYFVFKPNPYWPLVASSKRAGLVLAASLGAGSIIMVSALALGIIQPLGGSAPYTPPALPPTAISPGAAHWTVREGHEYGYVETLTDEEIKAGKVLADTKLFRFLGSKDNVYRVSTTKGPTTLTYACTNPCGMISVTSTTGAASTTSQLAFDGRRDLDLALIDAVNGKMQVYQNDPPPAEEPAKPAPKPSLKSRLKAFRHHAAAQ